MTQPTVYPLFSTPVYVNNVGDFQKPDVKALQYTSTIPTGGTYNFSSSVNKNVLELSSYAHVKTIVMKEVEFYARQILAVNEKIEFYITDSWINVHRRGQSAGPHMHHNSLVSGVLYLNTPAKSGDIVFHRDVLSLVPFPPALNLDMDRFNMYNCKSWGYTPKTNDICLFPSVVSHSVDVSESDDERWSLAFNVFVRGEFGMLHRLRIQ